MAKDFEITVEILHETEKAILVSDDGGETEHWIPRSQMEHESTLLPKVGQTITISIPEWLAEAKGLC